MIWNMPVSTFLVYHGISWGGAIAVIIYLVISVAKKLKKTKK